MKELIQFFVKIFIGVLVCNLILILVYQKRFNEMLDEIERNRYNLLDIKPKNIFLGSSHFRESIDISFF